MNLKEDLLRGIYSYGFEKPSAIQQRAIKPLLMMRDTIAQAQSGTGKTATFSIGAPRARGTPHEPVAARSRGAPSPMKALDRARHLSMLPWTDSVSASVPRRLWWGHMHMCMHMCMCEGSPAGNVARPRRLAAEHRPEQPRLPGAYPRADARARHADCQGRRCARRLPGRHHHGARRTHQDVCDRVAKEGGGRSCGLQQADSGALPHARRALHPIRLPAGERATEASAPSLGELLGQCRWQGGALGMLVCRGTDVRTAPGCLGPSVLGSRVPPVVVPLLRQAGVLSVCATPSSGVPS
eukprot:4448436-Prymnesium_polylepis.1